MSTEENKAIIRRYIEEAWNKGNVNIIDQVMADNYARYMPGSELPLDREGQKQARFANGKIVEQWGSRDDLGMLQQLGVIIPPQ